MKKQLFILMFNFILISCTPNDNTITFITPNNNNAPNNANVLLIERIVDHRVSDGVNTNNDFYTIFTYEGNKIKKIVKKGRFVPEVTTTFTYNNNLISGFFEHHYNYGTSQQYEYDTNNRVIKTIHFSAGEWNSGTTYTTTYQYNSNNTISYTQYAVNPSNEVVRTGTYYLDNNQVYKIVRDANQNNPAAEWLYNYDNKHFYGKNILGYEKVSFLSPIGEAGINNNRILPNYTYTYNSDNFITTKSNTNNSDEYVSTYIYQ